jgi:antitoxin ParD1/3/4
MNVSLTRRLKQFVAQKVASGSYETASEVIRDGLRLLQEGDKLRHQAVKELRQEILVGIEEANQGKLFPFTEATIRRAKARGRQRRKSNRHGSE